MANKEKDHRVEMKLLPSTHGNCSTQKLKKGQFVFSTGKSCPPASHCDINLKLCDKFAQVPKKSPKAFMRSRIQKQNRSGKDTMGQSTGSGSQLIFCWNNKPEKNQGLKEELERMWRCKGCADRST